MVSAGASMLIAITILYVWVILRPQGLVSSMAQWRRVFGGVEHRSQMPLWVVRVAGTVLLVITWFAFISSGAF
jgi:hypothetical protein